ncbi:MAG: glycoside hydrolase family 78 protein [Bacteroidota bacterium]
MIKKLTFAIVLWLIAAIGFMSCNMAESPARVTGLQCESQVNPLGIDREKPLLQWKLKDDRRGAAQTAWQVLAATSAELLNKDTGDLWDSGKVDSDQSVHLEYSGKPLNSGEAVYWKVRVWDAEGKPTAWSEAATWEMGLLNPADWQASWIARSMDAPTRSVYMRKEVSLSDKSVQKARLFVTGLGNYVFFINGSRVGNDLLTPGWTDFPKRLEYQVYDVTSMLGEGSNALGAMLGSMWWSGGLGWQGGVRYSEGPLKLLAQLQIEYSDGSADMVTTDTTWKWHDSPIVFDHIYHGETYDANLEIEGWNSPGFDDAEWFAAEPASYEGLLVGPRFPALREQMQLSPVSLNEPVSGEYVYDLGQNMVGWAQFMVNAPKGDTITLRYAELLHDDGTVAQENLRSARVTDKIISNGEPMVWEPKFTYHGFRYVQISGMKEKPAQTALIGKVIHTDQPFVGKLETSNELINKINRNITWGQRGNFFTVPTDCPQRDERLGWMGDAQIFAPTANFNMHLDRYWTKWMFDIFDGQHESGWVHDVSPAIVVGGPSKPGWGDAAVIVPWITYRYFGNTRIVEENYEGMKKWVDYMHSKSDNLIYIWNEGNGQWHGYGDWIAVEPTPSAPIGTAYFSYTAKLLSEMAEITGRSTDAAYYRDLSEKIAKAYQEKYWDKETLSYPGGTQTANLLPLAFGITPPELEGQVVKNLVENVKEKDVHPTTGFLGTGYILPMLSKYGHHDLAYRMINQTTYPSWGYMVEKGATSIWELWNSDTERPEGMNSRNHFALGCVGEWMWNTLAGVNICDEFPGFKRVIIRPEPVGDLKWVKAEYETNYGAVVVDWKVEGTTFTMDLTVPANTSALVEFPELKPGAVITEGGKDIAKGGIPGLSRDDEGNLVVLAGKYRFVSK